MGEVSDRVLKMANNPIPEKLVTWFNELTHKPKLITVGEYMNYPMHFSDTLSTERLTGVALNYWGRVPKSFYAEAIKNKNYECMFDDMIFSEIFSSTKVSWLCEEHRTVGLYAIMQGYVTDQKKILLHPGAHRFHATYILEDWDAKILVWDNVDFVDKPVLSFEEFLELFPKDKYWDLAILTNNSQIEVNVEEERDDIWDHCYKVLELFETHDLKITSKKDTPLSTLDKRGVLALSPTTKEFETKEAVFTLIHK